jgi:hypothetical protein
MTDGTVMIQDFCSPDWWSLTPDKHGSYINGTWTKKASMPSNYGPLFNASAVLADGKLIVEGGEYNGGGKAHCPESTFTKQGAIYNPKEDTWRRVNPPKGWKHISDAPSVVLSDGTYMLANSFSKLEALFNESTLTWTPTGKGKYDINMEEGWTLLPSGSVLTVDVFQEPNSELYDPSTGFWSTAGATPDNLTHHAEIGPQVLRPDGTVFVVGVIKYTAIYNSHSGKWSAGPDLPTVGGLELTGIDDPATLLPNGEILMPLSYGVSFPTYFFVTDGSSFRQVVAPPNATHKEEEQFHLLMLPTGQVLETDWSNDVEIYTPYGSAKRGLEPTVISVPNKLMHGRTYTVAGRHFNGYSQTTFEGDDEQMATNYPLVQITNDATRHVFYARTHNHSYMGVASPHIVSTEFDVPVSIETGQSTLVVIENGFRSAAVHVNIR